MPSIDFEVWCSECGAGLCRETTVNVNSRGVSVTVKPCEVCIKAAKTEGYEDGWENAKEDNEKEKTNG